MEVLGVGNSWGKFEPWINTAGKWKHSDLLYWENREASAQTTQRLP